MTTTTTTPAAEVAYTLAAERADAMRARKAATVELEAARQRYDEITREAGAAKDRAEDRAARASVDARRLLAALVNRDELEPLEASSSDYAGPVVTFAAALGHARVSLRRGQRAAAPRWHAYGWQRYPYSDEQHTGGDIYRPERGTNDPDKLETQRLEAIAAARAWMAPRTGAAWLEAHGIAPTDPAELVSVVGWAVGAPERGALSPRVALFLGYVDDGVPLGELGGYELLYGLGNARRPVLPPELLERLHALTLGNVPVPDLAAAVAAAEPIESRREAVSELLTYAAAPAIVAAFLEGYRTVAAD